MRGAAEQGRPLRTTAPPPGTPTREIGSAVQFSHAPPLERRYMYTAPTRFPEPSRAIRLGRAMASAPPPAAKARLCPKDPRQPTQSGGVSACSEPHTPLPAAHE